MRMDIDMADLTQYITDLTNGCAYLDQLVSNGSTDVTRINEVIKGIEYQLGISMVSESSEDLTSFNSSLTAAKNYLAGLGE
jgi:hypothetical protein